MKNEFNLKIFLWVFLGMHFIVYLSWSFVEMDLIIPIKQTFETSESRGFYLIFLFGILLLGMPHYLQFKED